MARGSGKRGKPPNRGRFGVRGRLSAGNATQGTEDDASESSKATTTNGNEIDSAMASSTPILSGNTTPPVLASTSSTPVDTPAGPSSTSAAGSALPPDQIPISATLPSDIIESSSSANNTPGLAPSSPLTLKFRTVPQSPSKPESSVTRKLKESPVKKPRPKMPRPVQTFVSALSFPKEESGHTGAGLGMAGWGAEAGGALTAPVRRPPVPIVAIPAPPVPAASGSTVDASGRKQRKSKMDAMGRLNEDGLGPQPPLNAASTSAARGGVGVGSRGGTPNPLAQPGSGTPTPSAQPANNPINKTIRMSPAPALDLATVRTSAPRYPPPRTQERMFGLKECPTFYPTHEEFKDPMEYIRLIGEGGGEGPAAEGAKKHGMCKVVPPEGWKMPFTLNTETFRFKTRLQRLNQLEASSRAKINYLQQLQMFHSQQGNPSVTIPIVDHKPLDIWALKKEIALRGGYEEICKNRLWGDLARSMGYTPNNSHQLKSAFTRIIQPFEAFLTHVKSASPAQSPSSAAMGSPLTPLGTPGTGMKATRGRPSEMAVDLLNSTPTRSAVKSTLGEEGSSRSTSVRLGEEGTALNAREPSPLAGPSMKSEPTSQRERSASRVTRLRNSSMSTNSSSDAKEGHLLTSVDEKGRRGSGDSESRTTRGKAADDMDVDMAEVDLDVVGTVVAEASAAEDLVKAEVDLAAGRKRKRMAGGDDPITPIKRGRPKKTMEEGNFEKGDACEICFSGAHAKKILLCDDCDRGYHIYCLDPPLAAVPDNEEWFCTECLLGTGNDFGFDEGEEHTISSFQRRATAFRRDWFHKHPPAGPISRPTDSDAMDLDNLTATNGVAETIDGLTITEHDVEKEFWRLVESPNDTVEIEYGADVHSTTHGSAAPTLESNPRDPHAIDPWNLNNMPILPKSLLRYIKSDISGMTVPWTYIGMLFATFCWHNEDHYTYSVNYMYWGDTKTWYGIAGDQAEKFEQAMMGEAPELFEQQPSLLYQLVTMMNPGRLKAAGLDVTVCDQRPNEFVITFPKAYHCGFNHGLNYNEAVNFALPDWLDYGYDCILRYQAHSKPPVFSHEELLVTISQHSQSIQTSLWLQEGLKTVVDREIAKRQELRATIPQLSEVVQNQDRPEDQYICLECKAYCYLAQMTCSCTKLISCLEHPSSLCKCLPNNRILRLRFSDKQLWDMVSKIADKALMPNTWRARLQRILDDSPRPAIKSLKSLLSEGERVTFPLPELDSLRHFVSQANSWLEMASTFLTKRMQPRSARRKGREVDIDDTISVIDDDDKERKTVEDLEALLRQVERAGFDAPEIGKLQNLRASIIDFRQQAQMILAQPEDELKLSACETIYITGSTLNVDLPEMTRLEPVVSRLRWLDTMEELDEPFLELKDVQRYLQEADDCMVSPHHEFYRNLQAKLRRGEAWNQRADSVLARAGVETEGKPNIKLDELDKLLEQDIETPVNREKQSRIRAVRTKALSAQQSCKTLMGQTDIKKRTITQLRRTIKAAEQKAGYVIVPELQSLQAELRRYDRWLKGLMTSLPHGADLSRVISSVVETARSLMVPEDFEPSDLSTQIGGDLPFACVCRQPAPASKFNMMLFCRKCEERYHPNCLKMERGEDAEGADRWKCPFCRKKNHLSREPRITATQLSDFVNNSEKWRFSFATQEWEELREVFVFALTIAKTVLPELKPTSRTDQSRNKVFMRHWLKKMHSFPVNVDPQTGDGRFFSLFDALFTRLRHVNRYNPSGPGDNTPVSLEEDRPGKIRPKRAELHLVRRNKDAAGCHCICWAEPPDSLVQVGCAKCRQRFHAACVYAPQESWGTNGRPWTCPLCAVQTGQLYPYATVLCQFEAHLGTSIYIDAVATARVGEIVTRIQPPPNNRQVMLIVANKFDPAVRVQRQPQPIPEPAMDRSRQGSGSGKSGGFNQQGSASFSRHAPGHGPSSNRGRPRDGLPGRPLPALGRQQIGFPVSLGRPSLERMNSPSVGAGSPGAPRINGVLPVFPIARPAIPGLPTPGAPGLSPSRLHGGIPPISNPQPRPFSAVTKTMVIPPFRGAKPPSASTSSPSAGPSKPPA